MADMTEATLIERLLSYSRHAHTFHAESLLTEAADKIEELQREIERLREGRKNDAEMIKSLRHRLRSGLAYGDALPCPTPCKTEFCERGGCRFQSDAADEAANV